MTTPARTVHANHAFKTSAGRVFDAWLDPAVTGKWLFATPDGEIVRCDIDARAGGRFTIVDRREGRDIAHEGEYLEIDRPRRLVFTFAVPYYSPEVSRVTIDLSPRDGGCDLHLANDGVAEEWAASTEAGWRDLLNALDVLLGAG